MNSLALEQLLPIVVGVGVVGLMLVGFALIGRVRTPRAESARATASTAGTTGGGLLSRSSDWEIPPESYANRRSSVRREGTPVKVTLSSPAFRNGTSSGYVVDRSTGGLRVVARYQVPPGSTMMVRAINAPDATPWVTVTVRSCRYSGKHYELGCEFDQTPPWNVLLLFG